MAETGGVKSWAVPKKLEAPRAIARHMVEDDGVKRWAAPRQLLPEARNIARLMVEADGADRRACTNLAVARSVNCRHCVKDAPETSPRE